MVHPVQYVLEYIYIHLYSKPSMVKGLDIEQRSVLPTEYLYLYRYLMKKFKFEYSGNWI